MNIKQIIKKFIGIFRPKKVLEGKTNKRGRYDRKTNSGVKYLNKIKRNNCKQRFAWNYIYTDDNGEEIRIQRVNLPELEFEIKKRGLPFIIQNEALYEHNKALYASNSEKPSIIADNTNYANEKEIADNTNYANEKEIADKYNESGVLYVKKIKSSTSQGFYWNYYRNENGKQKYINRVNLVDLEKEVRKQGYPWIILDENVYQANKALYEANKIAIIGSKTGRENTTGILNVSKTIMSNCKQGFSWSYYYKDKNGKKRCINRINFNELEAVVKEKGLKWIILDETKYKNIKKLYSDVSNKPESTYDNENFAASGIRYVHKIKNYNSKLGFNWRYYYNKNGKRLQINRNNLVDLEKEIRKQGHPWIVINKKVYEANKALYINNDDKKEVTTKQTKLEPDDTSTVKYDNIVHVADDFKDSGVLYVKKICQVYANSQGFVWKYYKNINDEKIQIQRVNFNELEQIIKEKGYPWIVLDKNVYEANRALYINNNDSVNQEHGESKSEPKNKVTSTVKYENKDYAASGVKFVRKYECKSCKQGYSWRYIYEDNQIERVNINDLEVAVKEKGYPWLIINLNTYLANKAKYPTIKTETGVKNVYKSPYKTSKQGYIWEYKFQDFAFSKINFNDLERLVKGRGLPWDIINYEVYLNNKALYIGDEKQKTLTIIDDDDINKKVAKLDTNKFKRMVISADGTGVRHVYTLVADTTEQGFVFQYCYYDNKGNRNSIIRVNFKDLEAEVHSRGLEWTILDKSKYLAIRALYD